MVVNTVRWSPNQDTPTGMISPEADDPQLLLWSPIALTSWNSGDSLLNQQNSAMNSKCIRYFFFRQIEWPTSDSETSTSDSETCGPTDSETCCRSDSETWGCWIGVSESGRVSESEYIPGRILRQCLLAPNRSHPKKRSCFDHVAGTKLRIAMTNFRKWAKQWNPRVIWYTLEFGIGWFRTIYTY